MTILASLVVALLLIGSVAILWAVLNPKWQRGGAYEAMGLAVGGSYCLIAAGVLAILGYVFLLVDRI